MLRLMHKSAVKIESSDIFIHGIGIRDEIDLDILRTVIISFAEKLSYIKGG